MTWDAVVIGSGPGGLTAAVALARAGQKVLVVEQHYLPGGWTHSFTLEGYRFSPGVHYIGELHPGGGVRRLYEGLGIGADLEFCELNPDGFDHVLICGTRIDQPKGLHRWLERLCARFPHERQGIHRYFATVTRIATDLKKADEHLGFPDVLSLPLRVPHLTRWGVSTLGSLLHRCIRDPLLRGILSAQSGNHGVPPSRVSLPVHCAMTAHYYDGGFYPRGGAKRIPQALIKELRRNGGKIRTRARVTRILVESGRAAGIELETGERIFASSVICNADPAVTYGKLLDREYCPRETRKVAKMDYSVALLSLFCAVDMDLRRLGYDSGNYWWYRTADVDALYAKMNDAMPGAEVDALFLTITTLKDPGHQHNGHHVLEMFTFLPYAGFERWKSEAMGLRGADYQTLKRALADKVLAAAENVIPGIRRRIRFLEIGSPLTNDFYCETFRGACYGTAKTPWQVGPFSFSQRGPIDGLHLCGASTLSHGVAGSSLSGLFAAQRVLGVDRPDDLLSPPDGSLRVYPADHPEEWLIDQTDQAEAGTAAKVSRVA